MSLKDEIKDIKQLLDNQGHVKINDPNYAIYKIDRHGRLIPWNATAAKHSVFTFDKEAQLKILEEEGYITKPSDFTDEERGQIKELAKSLSKPDKPCSILEEEE